MAQTIKLKRSGTQNAVPTTSQLALGEVALNTYDGKMYIKKSVGGTESIVEIGGDATSSSGLDFTGNLNLEDNVRIVIGDGNDLQIYHDGSNSFINDSGTGNLTIRATNLALQSAAAENYLFAAADGSVTVYHDNSAKLATTSSGVSVTGNISGSGGLGVSGNITVGSSSSAVISLERASSNYILANNSGTGRLYIGAGSELVFLTGQSDGDYTQNEKIRIDSSGRLLVNTTSSIDNLAKIQVVGDSSSIARITLQDVDGTNQKTYFEQSGGGTRISTQNGTSNGFFTIGAWDGTTSSDFVRVTSTGRVGIGTNSPSSPLHINDSSNSFQLRMQRNSTNYWGFQLTNSSLHFYDFANSTAPMVIDSSGNVGINETSPAHKLEVSGDGHLIRATGTTSGGSARIGVYNENDGSGNGGATVYMESSGWGEGFVYVGAHYLSAAGGDFNIRAGSGTDLTFGNGTTEYARISGAGDVLVGKTSSALNTAGAEIATSGRTRFTRDSANVVEINRTTDAGSIITFNVDGSMVGNIGSSAARLFIHNNYGNGSGFRFDNGSINPASSSGANEDNTTDLGASAARFKDLHLSGQVNTGTISSGNITTSGTITFSNSHYLQAGTGNLFFKNSSNAALGGIDAAGFNTAYNYQISGTTVITSARQITNVTSITATGAISTTGTASLGAINVGSSTSGNLFFKRPNANYIFADQSGGYLVFGTNGRSTSVANSNFYLGTNQDVHFQGSISVASNITSSGVVNAGTHLNVNSSGNLLKVDISAWDSLGNNDQAILWNGYNSTIGDHIVLKAAGNGTTHGAIVVADGVFSYGSTTSAVSTSASLTAPLSSGTAFTVTSGGNAAFAGTLSSSGTGTSSFAGPVTVGGTTLGNAFEFQVNGDARITGFVEAGSAQLGNTTLTGFLRGPSTFTIDPSAHGDNTGTVVIAGNLQVDGTTTTINSTTLTVDDKNITLASGSTNAAAANGAGLTVDCGSDTDATWTYSSGDDAWKSNKHILAYTGGGTGVFAVGRDANQAIQIDVSDNYNKITAHQDADENGDHFFDLIRDFDGTGKSDFRIMNQSSVHMLVDKDGKVGIGTTSPSEKLDISSGSILLDNDYSIGWGDNSARINGSGSGERIIFTTSTSERLRIDASGNILHQNGSPEYHFGTTSASHYNWRVAAQEVVDAGFEIASGTQSAGSGALSDTYTTRFVIKGGTGNVGIGTTSPAHKLHVDGGAMFNTNTGSTPVYITRSGATDQALKIHVDDASVIFESAQDESLDNYGNFIFALDSGTTEPFFSVRKGTSSSNTLLQVDGGGNVGIGTASPQNLLHVDGGSIRLTDTEGMFIIPNGSSDSVSGNYFTSLGGGSFTHLPFVWRLAGANRMLLDTSGRLGIGTTSPSTQLHVSSTSTSTLTVQNTTNAGNASLHFRDENNVDQYKVLYDLPNNRAEQHFNGNGLRFYSNQISAEVAKIGFGNGYNSSYFAGRVGIGLSSPTYKLDVNAGSAIVARFTGGDSNGITSIFTRPSEQGLKTWSGNSYYSGLVAGAHFQIFTNNSSGTPRVTVLDTGNVGIGTTSPGSKLSVHGALADYSTTHPSATNSTLELRDTRAVAAGNGASIVLTGVYTSGGSHLGNAPYIKSYKVNSTDGNYAFGLKFATRQNGVGAQAVAMTIDDEQRVGIGTTTPSQKLEVAGNAIISGSSNTGSNVALNIGGTGNSAIRTRHIEGKDYQSASTGDLYLNHYHNGNIIMNNGGGNLGMGTSSPARQIHVKDTNYSVARLERDGAGGGVALEFKNGDGNIWQVSNDGDEVLRFYYATNNRFQVTSTGAATFNNAFTFPTSDGSGNQVLQTDGSGNVSWATISGVGTATEIADADGDTRIQTEESSDEDKIRFDVAGTQKAVIDSSNFTVTSGGFRVDDPGNNYPFRVTGYGYMTSRGASITQLNATGDHANVPLSVLADVASTRTASYVEIGDIGSAGNRFKIDNTGRVGIGTTAPAKTLDVAANGSNQGIHLNISGVGRLQMYADGDRNYFKGLSGNGHRITTTGGANVEILNNGNVGIGTTSPETDLNLRDRFYSPNETNGRILNWYATTGGTELNNTNHGFVFCDEDTTTSQPGRVGLALANNTTTNNVWSPAITFGGLSTSGNYQSAGAAIAAKLPSAADTNFRSGELHFFVSGTANADRGLVSKMVFDSSGNLGIGTTSPSEKLHVTDTVFIDYPDGSGASLKIGRNDTSNYWEVGHAGGDFRLYNTAGSGSDILFGVQNGGVDQGNKVGIGTATPDKKLTVDGDIKVGNGDAFMSANVAGSTRSLISLGTDNVLRIKGNDAEGSSNVISMINGGNVGIGIVAPEEKLHVETGSIFVTPVSYASNRDEYIIKTGAHNSSNWDGLGFKLKSDASGVPYISVMGGVSAETMVWKSGNVGIGTASPASNLHVKTFVDNSVSQGIIVERSVNSDRGYINYSGGAFQFRSTVGDPIVFGETDAEHMRILPDGNVGIGTTTPDEFGIGSSFRILSVGGDATGVVNIVDNNTNGSYLQFGNAAGLRRASIHSLDGSNLIFTLNSNNSGTALTERMRLERTGNWMVSNTVANVASAYSNQGGCGWVESDNHFEVATTSNRSAVEFGRNNGNSGDVITIRQQGTSVGMIGTEGGDSLVIQSNGSTGTGIRFHPSRAAVEPVRAGVTIDNTISLGADTRRFKDLHLSNAANIGHASIETSSTSTSATTQVAIASFAAATFRGAEFTIQVTNSTDSTYHLTKVLLIHDGTTPGITEYGTVFTGSAVEATFDADISSGNVRLLATPASTDSMTFKVVRHCITV